MRWDPYVHAKGDRFTSFWRELLGIGNRNLLFCLAHGFDPRMLVGLEAILSLGGTGKRDVWLLAFDEGPDSPSLDYATYSEANVKRLKSLIDTRGNLQTKQVKMWSGPGPGKHRTSSRSAAEAVPTLSLLQQYTDVIVDIGSMPRSVYFAFIGKLLHSLDQESRERGGKSPNLHVVTAENPELDMRIKPSGIDEDASYVYGLVYRLDIASMADVPTVWIPILGEGFEEQLRRLYDGIAPDEICPVLPSPSKNPRRGDDLILEYRELLFDSWRVEPRNIVYAAEDNPFEAYRQIFRTVSYYNSALQPLEGCKAILSPLSSKLLSVGALLAAFDLKARNQSIGIMHIESHGYEVDNLEKVLMPTTLHSMCLCGEFYSA